MRDARRHRERMTPVVRNMVLATTISALGNGMVFPFTLIYLNQVRGIALSTSGLIIAVMGLVSIAVTPLAGIGIERASATRTGQVAFVLSAVAYALMPLVRTAPLAFVLAVFIGAGMGLWTPAVSTVLGEVATGNQRTRAFALQRAGMNLGVGLGGAIGGFVAVTERPSTFTLLFLLDALTFLPPIFLLPRHIARPVRQAGSLVGTYREVLQDKFYVRFLVLDFGTALCFAFGFDLLPAHASAVLGLSNTLIGWLFVANTLTVVLLQMPTVSLLAGRHRLHAYSAMGVLWTVGFAIVLGAAGRTVLGAAALLAAAVSVMGLAECIMGAVRGPLTAELAPDRLLGRYYALGSAVFSIGLAAGRAMGGFVLDASQQALWWMGVAVGVAMTVGPLTITRSMPVALHRSPVQGRR